MDTEPYDVWYDPNEIDETNHAQVLRAWARPNLEITFGKIVLMNKPPVPARIVSFNEATDIITLEVLFNQQHTAVA